MDPLEQFVRVSARLTGFDRVDLLGTGVARAYLDTLEAAAPQAIVADLLTAASDPDDGALTVRLASPDVGPVARNVIYLWYTGSWQQLSSDWRSAHGTRPGDQTHVVSPAAYLAGLQWKAVRAHAPGGNPTGFGSWAEPAQGPIR